MTQGKEIPEAQDNTVESASALNESVDYGAQHTELFQSLVRREFEERGLHFVDGFEDQEWGIETNHDKYKVLAGIFGGKAEELYVAIQNEWGFNAVPLKELMRVLIVDTRYEYFMDPERAKKVRDARRIVEEFPQYFPEDYLGNLDDFDFVFQALEMNELPYRDTFTVSAYYSPKEGQSRYSTGSYEKDIRLNGKGAQGFWEDPVFAGMIAAPRGYARGTKLMMPDVLEGTEVFTVADRGGAIVKAGERGYKHDRIDVWFGEGEDALLKALEWGKRDVEAIVIPVTEDLDGVVLADAS